MTGHKEKLKALNLKLKTLNAEFKIFDKEYNKFMNNYDKQSNIFSVRYEKLTRAIEATSEKIDMLTNSERVKKSKQPEHINKALKLLKNNGYNISKAI